MSKLIEKQLQTIAENSQAVFEKIENDYATKEEIANKDEEIKTFLNDFITLQDEFLGIIDKGPTGDCAWKLYDNGTLTISGTGAMEDYGHPLGIDAPHTPWSEAIITKVILKDGVTSIGDYTFYDCDSLTSITIPNSVTSIGSYAFYWCTSLTSVSLGDSVTSIDDYVFEGCERLTSITLPDSVTSIGDAAFRYCISLTSITIPDSVTSIGGSAFYDCTKLTSVTIGDSVTSIGSSTFNNCSSLTSIIIPDSVTSIGFGAFYNCYSLTNIIVDENNKNYSSLDGVLFNKDKTTLIWYPIGKTNTSYTIPDSVTKIDGAAFYKCKNLTSITIPASLKNIGGSAFFKCTNLKTVNYKGSEEDKNKITINSTGNEPLVSATWKCNYVG